MADLRVGHVNTSLEAAREVTLSSSTSEDLSFDDELVLLGAYREHGREVTSKGRWRRSSAQAQAMSRENLGCKGIIEARGDADGRSFQTNSIEL
jgi:hypothetical protein